MRLRSHLFLLVAGAVLPLALVTIVLGALLVEQVQDTFRRGALDRNRAFMSAVDAEIQGHVNALRAIAASRHFREGDLEGFHADLGRVLPSQPAWRTVILSDADGASLLNAAEPLGESASPDDDPASLASAVASRSPVVGSVVRWGSVGDYGIAVRLPILRDGRVESVLTAVIGVSQFQRLMDAQQLPATWVSGLVDRSGRFIARVPARSPDFVASPDFRAATVRAGEGWYRGHTVEGSDTYTAHLTSSRSGWGVGLAIPTPLVHAAATRAGWTVALGVLSTLLVALGFAYVMGERLARPIAALAARARPWKGAPAPVATGIVELAEVAGALDEADDAAEERRSLLEREREALRAADRAKDEFLAMLGHELRNPLSAINTSTYLLRSAAPGDARRSEALAILERQARQMTRLVDDLLEVSRLTMRKVELQREVFDLAELARSLVQMWERSNRAAPGRLRVAVEAAWVEADRGRLEQVLANLLDNASKFSPADAEISVRVFARDGEAVLDVSDAGPGIEPALLERVFDRFVQSAQGPDRASGGLGLGLAVVRLLVELHGGSVRADNLEGGRGARLTVRLPLARAPQTAVRAASSSSPVARALRILVVEDIADAREMLEAFLGLHGHVVQSAASGVEAIAAIVRQVPDVVLLDIGLPDITGYEVARRFRREASMRHAWVVALTGYGQSEDERRAREAGCDRHMRKPVEPHLLLALIAELGAAARSAEPRSWKIGANPAESQA